MPPSSRRANVIRIDVINRQTALAIDRHQLRRAVRTVLRGEAVAEAEIELAVVDDPAIRQLNDRYLHHDEATDVLSFLLERSATFLEGQVVVSADRAQAVAPQVGGSPAEELLLYAIHGTLHLVGYEDDTPRQRSKMQARERHYLSRLGLDRH